MSETRKIAAIQVLDVVGYSRLAGADEDRTLSRLRGLRSDLIDPAIAAHHGRIVKRTGDGSLVEFRSVVDAVRCAIEVQNGMVERNAGLPQERRIEFRIGIHLGDVVEEEDGDLMGDGVNIAARLEGIAQPGMICLSEQAYWQVKGRLDLAVTDLGPTRLKNIAEPVRAYSLQVGMPAVAKPATGTKPPEPVKRSFLATLAAGIAALVLIAAGLWYFLGANRPAAVATNGRLSIVVLPFANISADPAQDYLADAVTDELTTGLARIAGSFVIARNTAYTYKGKPVDAKAIGKDLGVRYVLEGSVQPGGNQVRVNAQLIDADSGAHVWAEQFDTASADLLQMQDEIVAHLVRALELQLPEAEVARLKRSPAANPTGEDLALQCESAVRKAGFFGKQADAGYSLCEQAIAADPNNVLALSTLSVKFWLAVALGVSANPKADFDRADELVSRALAVDPNYAYAHHFKAHLLLLQIRPGEAVAENERALALDPSLADGYESLGNDYMYLGQFDKSLEYYDRAIRLSPHDSALFFWDGEKAGAHFALKQYGPAIEWARRAIAINGAWAGAHATLIAALALDGHEAEAAEALLAYLGPPAPALRTIASWNAYNAQNTDSHTDPRYTEYFNRVIEGLRKAGMPEDDKPRLSIVVLPFANLSGDPAQDYLADALTDELTTSLARIRDSFVIARNTAFTYRGKPVDAKAIGKDLGVRYALEGSVQPTGNQVRVNAQLIDAESGAHLWAEQFDTPRADLLQMQDEIVTHLAHSIALQLPEFEASGLKRAPATNPAAEDLALQCTAAEQKAEYIGKEADAGYRLCEQALAVDPNNVRALSLLSVKFWLPIWFGLSADPKADLERGDELVSKALALDPNYARAHVWKANILMLEARNDEAIGEAERALALDPAMVDAEVLLGSGTMHLGQFEKSIEYYDKAIRRSPHDPTLFATYGSIAHDYFALKQYDQSIEWDRRAITINPANGLANGALIAAYAFTGREPEAHEALQRYLALSYPGLKTIAAFKALEVQVTDPHGGPRFPESLDRLIEGLRKTGMPET